MADPVGVESPAGTSELCVSGLKWWVSDRDLAVALNPFGRVIRIRFASTPVNGRSTGCAVVTFADNAQAVAKGVMASPPPILDSAQDIMLSVVDEEGANSFLEAATFPNGRADSQEHASRHLLNSNDSTLYETSNHGGAKEVDQVLDLVGNQPSHHHSQSRHRHHQKYQQQKHQLQSLPPHLHPQQSISNSLPNIHPAHQMHPNISQAPKLHPLEQIHAHQQPPVSAEMAPFPIQPTPGFNPQPPPGFPIPPGIPGMHLPHGLPVMPGGFPMPPTMPGLPPPPGLHPGLHGLIPGLPPGLPPPGLPPGMLQFMFPPPPGAAMNNQVDAMASMEPGASGPLLLPTARLENQVPSQQSLPGYLPDDSNIKSKDVSGTGEITASKKLVEACSSSHGDKEMKGVKLTNPLPGKDEDSVQNPSADERIIVASDKVNRPVRMPNSSVSAKAESEHIVQQCTPLSEADEADIQHTSVPDLKNAPIPSYSRDVAHADALLTKEKLEESGPSGVAEGRTKEDSMVDREKSTTREVLLRGDRNLVNDLESFGHHGVNNRAFSPVNEDGARKAFHPRDSHISDDVRGDERDVYYSRESNALSTRSAAFEDGRVMQRESNDQLGFSKRVNDDAYDRRLHIEGRVATQDVFERHGESTRRPESIRRERTRDHASREERDGYRGSHGRDDMRDHVRREADPLLSERYGYREARHHNEDDANTGQSRRSRSPAFRHERSSSRSPAASPRLRQEYGRRVKADRLDGRSPDRLSDRSYERLSRRSRVLSPVRYRDESPDRGSGHVARGSSMRAEGRSPTRDISSRDFPARFIGHSPERDIPRDRPSSRHRTYSRSPSDSRSRSLSRSPSRSPVKRRRFQHDGHVEPRRVQQGVGRDDNHSGGKLLQPGSSEMDFGAGVGGPSRVSSVGMDGVVSNVSGKKPRKRGSRRNRRGHTSGVNEGVSGTNVAPAPGRGRRKR